MAAYRISRSLNVLRLIRSNISLVSLNASNRKCTQSYGSNLLQYRTVSCSLNCRVDANSADENETKTRPKTARIPQITLVFPDDSLTVTTLENAQKIAKRRGFTLVKADEQQSKSDKETYKLLHGREFVSDERNQVPTARSKKKDSFKSTKLIELNSKISKNDLLTKIKHIKKLLQKRHKIKVLILINEVNGNTVINTIKTQTKQDGNVTETRSKHGSATLIISPLLKDDKASPVEETLSNEAEPQNRDKDT